ncbi:MAG: dimethylamine monooxygenase subunit DmmA family protein [Gordonia sp. (in: high G+C Gram-positive bacteria)]
MAEAIPESQIAYSSIPDWARPGAPRTTDGPPAAASYVLVGVGESGAAQVDTWAGALGPKAPISRVVHADLDGAASGLRSAIARSAVGVRVLVAASAGDGLCLRAVAVGAGLEDDELAVTVVDPDPGTAAIAVFCSHCRTTNHVAAEVDDVVGCGGCHRDLLVYYHVSRRSGAYLGFMVDAETPAGTSASASAPAPQEAAR